MNVFIKIKNHHHGYYHNCHHHYHHYDPLWPPPLWPIMTTIIMTHHHYQSITTNHCHHHRSSPPPWLESLKTAHPRFKSLLVNMYGASKLCARYLGCPIQTFQTGPPSLPPSSPLTTDSFHLPSQINRLWYYYGIILTNWIAILDPWF